MKRALVAALLSALATAAVLATVGFGANSTATTLEEEVLEVRADDPVRAAARR